MVDLHLSRLIAHLVLVLILSLFRALGLPGKTECEDAILISFTKYLMSQERLSLVPWYVSRLPSHQQLPTLFSFLTRLTETED